MPAMWGAPAVLSGSSESLSAPYACPGRRHLFVCGIASCVPGATVCGCSELAETGSIDVAGHKKATYMGMWWRWVWRQCSNITFRVAGLSHIFSRPSRRVSA